MKRQNFALLDSLMGVVILCHSLDLGGSTEEAQKAIGLEVASALIKYVNTGSTLGAVNVPRVELRAPREGTVRVLNIHHNIPGVLKVSHVEQASGHL